FRGPVPHRSLARFDLEFRRVRAAQCNRRVRRETLGDVHRPALGAGGGAGGPPVEAPTRSGHRGQLSFRLPDDFLLSGRFGKESPHVLEIRHSVRLIVRTNMCNGLSKVLDVFGRRHPLLTILATLAMAALATTALLSQSGA